MCEYVQDVNATFLEAYLHDLVWPSETHKTYALDVKIENEYYETTNYKRIRTLTKNMIIVKVRFKSPFIDMTVLDSRTTLSDKIAKLGGTYGLWVQLTGCALLVLLNIALVAIKLGFRICKLRPCLKILGRN